MRLQTLVALTDFSPSAEQAVARAALLAAEHKAELHLLHGSAGPDVKHVDPQARLEQLARQLARRHGIVCLQRRRSPVQDLDAAAQAQCR